MGIVDTFLKIFDVGHFQIDIDLSSISNHTETDFPARETVPAFYAVWTGVSVPFVIFVCKDLDCKYPNQD